jgi:uncharacterized integral membrane protein
MANRDVVSLRFVPLALDRSVPLWELPLYLVILGSIAFGVLLGGITVWLSQGKYRKSLRISRKEIERLQRELDDMRREKAVITAPPHSETVIAPSYPALAGS